MRHRLTMNTLQMTDALERLAELLEMRGENPLRVDAYHRAAEMIGLRPVLTREHRDAIADDLLARPFGVEVDDAITEALAADRLALLEDLESRPGPREILQSIPGVGPVLAARLNDRLGVETLKELERAASDGRLDAVAGIAKGKAVAIRDELRRILVESNRELGVSGELPPPPPLELLLTLDIEYRHRASVGDLDNVTPRRFNPNDEQWLGVLRERREQWRFTVAYANTRRAHEERKVRDWVSIWFATDGVEESSTVITSQTAVLRGQRVVRGREGECRRLYHGSVQSAVVQMR